MLDLERSSVRTHPADIIDPLNTVPPLNASSLYTQSPTRTQSTANKLSINHESIVGRLEHDGGTKLPD